MAVIVVTSNAAGEGKTGVAAAIARHYAYLGTPVTIARAAGDGANPMDASYLGSLTFTPGSPSAAAPASSLADPGPGRLLVVEAEPAAAASFPNATIVLVSREAAGPPPAGLTPAAIVVTDVDGLRGVSVPEATTMATILLGEDRTLAGFSVDEVKATLRAEILVEGDVSDATCDYLVIAPISSDAGQPYFKRFSSKAVVVRFDKTDMHLAAMKADPACLILTGGRRPSEYLFDAATANGVPVLLSRTDTENTVIALEGIFDRTRFVGERKLDRMCELLESSPLFDILGR